MVDLQMRRDGLPVRISGSSGWGPRWWCVCCFHWIYQRCNAAKQRFGL